MLFRGCQGNGLVRHPSRSFCMEPAILYKNDPSQKVVTFDLIRKGQNDVMGDQK
jgi:hypothetical protein